MSDSPAGAVRTVLCLFAGKQRRADVKHQFVSIGRAKGIKVKVVELDILRSRKHDTSLAQWRTY